MRYVQCLDKHKADKAGGQEDPVTSLIAMLSAMQKLHPAIADMVSPVLVLLRAPSSSDATSAKAVGYAVRTISSTKTTNMFYLTFWNAGFTRTVINHVPICLLA